MANRYPPPGETEPQNKILRQLKREGRLVLDGRARRSLLVLQGLGLVEFEHRKVTVKHPTSPSAYYKRDEFVVTPGPDLALSK